MSQSHKLVFPELKTKCHISSSGDNFRIWKHKLDYILKLASLEEKLFKYLSRLEIDQKKNLHSSRRCLVRENVKWSWSAGLHVGHPLGYTATDILERLQCFAPNGMGCIWIAC
ncbi:hypothetical protein EZV62_026242 [Acer yangbiense]|uniref:Uncharacterized protein n=1 Tax=Acer yangbiense TaxID=1000413 RepID=A0A5C7GQL8_9ROSI|nr:hypothetical protein EZV62_026242 [Acer yangbiense]